MAQRVDYHPLEAAFSALLDQGLDGAGEALRILVNEASKIERARFLNARPHPSVPTMMRHRPAGSLPLRAEVTTSDGYARFA